MRALEARRRRRRRWLAGTGAVAVVAAAAVGVTLGISGGARTGSPGPKLASLSTLGTLRAAPSPGPAGPGGVPVPRAAPRAATATGASGQRPGGISGQTRGQAILEIH